MSDLSTTLDRLGVGSGGTKQRARQFNGNGDPAKESIFSHPVMIRLNTVEPKPVTWLWPGRIAIGKLTMLSGDPGLGKSLLTIDLSARVSIGAPWPDSLDRAPLGGVVMLSAEDDPADTIRPRLDAAGADCSHISLLSGISRSDPEEDEQFLATFNLARDLGALEQAIDSTPGCRLVSIDPISAYCGGTDSHKNADVRGLRAPLSELAQRRQVAVVGVNHLNKSAAGGPAMYRTMGSLAFVAAARAAWAVVKDKEDPTKRLFLPLKNNLAADVAGLSYTVVEQNGVPCLAWSPDPVSITADEAMALERPDGRAHERNETMDWLRAALADGPLTCKEVERQAKEAGLAWRTVKRVKRDLKVVARKEGFGPNGGWVWTIPECSQGGESAKGAKDFKGGHIKELAPLAKVGPLSDDLNDLLLESAAADGEVVW